MTLDSSVMNVSIATVAEDVSTTVTGIQTAITLYTLVMAALMITGGKLGQILGRKRAFAIGCVIYGCGSFTTAIAPNLAVLHPRLVVPRRCRGGADHARHRRPRGVELRRAGAAPRLRAGGVGGRDGGRRRAADRGLFTTYLSWRLVFAGEVLVVIAILVMTRRIADTPADPDAKLDLVGTVLSAVGLGLVVYGVLRAGTWGFVRPKAEGPVWLGLSPVIWLMLAGCAVLVGFFLPGSGTASTTARAALIDPAMLRNAQLQGGLTAFFFQFLLQAGLFFVVPLFLSVALGLSAIATGVRLLPLSVTLLLAAVGIPKLFPHASPRRVVRLGFVALLVGIVVMIALLDVGAGPEIVTWPMLLAGLGVGALASQLGAVTVSCGARRAERRGRRPAEHGHQPGRLDRRRR